jgi:hypothetical protein
MDEEEKLTDKDKIDYRSMLLGGYKKGMKVPRSQEGKKKSHFTVSEYEVYAPKIMANIGGIEDVLEDRCITLILLRTTNRRKSNSEIDINDVKWQNIRDKLYDNLMLNHQQISRCYNLLSDTFTSDGIEDSDVVSVVTDVSVDIYGYRKLENNNNSSISSTLTTDTTQTTLKKLENIRARDLELWQPILSIALAIDEDIFSKLTDFAIENIKNKEVENQTESYDSILIESLIDVIEEDRYYKVSEILSKMIMYVGADEKSREYNWLNNKWLGRAMRRLGFLDKRRMGVGVEYHLSPEGIRFLAMRSKVGLDKYIKKTEQKIL